VPQGIALAALYAVISLVRSVLEPKIMAAQAGLPPLAALAAMYVGFSACGVAGMLLFPVGLLFVKQLHDAGFLRLWK
jgi:predicted PurR-regulated permease PerM